MGHYESNSAAASVFVNQAQGRNTQNQRPCDMREVAVFTLENELHITGAKFFNCHVYQLLAAAEDR